MSRLFFPLLLVLAISGCGQDIELPPAAPLSASAEQLAAIPNLEPGSYKVEKGEPLEWQLGERVLRVRTVSPTGDGPFPLVVFSHGFASDIDKYDALLEHWASHGYLSISPYHLDGGGTVRAIFQSITKGDEGLVAGRVEDVRLVLDNLDGLDGITDGLSRRIDRDRIAVAGHSFGAFTAQQFGGAAAINPETGTRIEGRDPRVKAVLAISPPSEMFDIINKQSWETMDLPMLATTGTWDMDGRFVTDWRQHRLSWETAKPGQNWLLVIQGADHYLGNLICRPELDTPPQTDALRMVNAMSVSFLHAFLNNRPGELAFLFSDRLKDLTGGFASLTHR